jgi:hypothetical protein
VSAPPAPDAPRGFAKLLAFVESPGMAPVALLGVLMGAGLAVALEALAPAPALRPEALAFPGGAFVAAAGGFVAAVIVAVALGLGRRGSAPPAEEP